MELPLQSAWTVILISLYLSCVIRALSGLALLERLPSPHLLQPGSGSSTYCFLKDLNHRFPRRWKLISWLGASLTFAVDGDYIRVAVILKKESLGEQGLGPQNGSAARLYQVGFCSWGRRDGAGTRKEVGRRTQGLGLPRLAGGRGKG